MLAIASISGWDGVRILGAFETKEIALEICGAAGFDIGSDSFHIDIIEKNKISTHTQLIVDGSRRTGRFVKVHVYNEIGQSSNNSS